MPHTLFTRCPEFQAPNDTPDGAAAPAYNTFPFSHQPNMFDRDRTNLSVRWDSLSSYMMVSTRKHRVSHESTTPILVSTGEGVKQAIGNSTLRSYRTKVSRRAILATRTRRSRHSRHFLHPIDASAPGCGWSTDSDRVGAKLWVTVGHTDTSMGPRTSGDGGGMQARRCRP